MSTLFPRGVPWPSLARVPALHRLDAVDWCAMLILRSSLTHFVNGLRQAGARWSPGDELDRLLDLSLPRSSGFSLVSGSSQDHQHKPYEATCRRCRDVSAGPALRATCVQRVLEAVFSRVGQAARPHTAKKRPWLSSSTSGARPCVSRPGEHGQLGTAVTALLESNGFTLTPAVWFLSLAGQGQCHNQHHSAKTSQPVLTGRPMLTKSGNTVLTEPSEDMADHYGDAELTYGDFRNRLPADVRETVHAATKWCVFGPVSQPVSTQYVLQAVQLLQARRAPAVPLARCE